MVKAENTNWQEIEHSPFALPYMGHIVVQALSGKEMTVEQMDVAAKHLTLYPQSGIQRIELDTDPYLPRLMCNVNFEAEGDNDAMRELSEAVIEAWAYAGYDPEDLEFVEAHLAYTPQLEADQIEDPSLDITSVRYTIEELEIGELDEFEKPVTIEARRIFDESRGRACDNAA